MFIGCYVLLEGFIAFCSEAVFVHFWFGVPHSKFVHQMHVANIQFRVRHHCPYANFNGTEGWKKKQLQGNESSFSAMVLLNKEGKFVDQCYM